MASDKLVSSVDHVFEIEDGQGYKRRFKVWIKSYASGRTRVLLPPGFEVVAMVNGSRMTEDIQVELKPKARTA